MALRCTSSQLLSFNHSAPPTLDLISTMQQHCLLRRRPYIHRSSRRKYILHSSTETGIPSLWTDHNTRHLGNFQLVDHHNQILSSCLNQFAPLKTATVSFSTSAPWYTPDRHNLKKKRRQLERLRTKTGLTAHAEANKYFTNTYNTALKSARSDYFSQLIRSNSSHSRTLFSTFARLTKPIDNITSTFTTDKCNNYLSFFHSKIHTVPCTALPLTISPLKPISLSTYPEITGFPPSPCSQQPTPPSSSPT
uniref:Uncharacterized protein n=1 Tax=Knipowitschia caucasica TaxID=637954 RepID=A0AAV2JHC9_KNICA